MTVVSRQVVYQYAVNPVRFYWVRSFRPGWDRVYSIKAEVSLLVGKPLNFGRCYATAAAAGSGSWR
jgi:hypothetical protein